MATREAFGAALLALGEANSLVVALDADVKNSTYSDKFGKAVSGPVPRNFIAEQNMLGAAAALPLAVRFRSWRPSPRFSRARMIFIRMAAISQSNIKLVGTHVGVSIGEGWSVADGTRRSGHDVDPAWRDRALSVRWPVDVQIDGVGCSPKGMVYCAPVVPRRR